MFCLTTRHIHSVTLVEVDEGLVHPGLEEKGQEANRVSVPLVLMEAQCIQPEENPS